MFIVVFKLALRKAEGKGYNKTQREFLNSAVRNIIQELSAVFPKYAQQIIPM